MKWLAAGAAVVVVILVLLLRSVMSDDAPAPPGDHPVAAGPPQDAPLAFGQIRNRFDAHVIEATDDLPEGPEPANPDDADANTGEFHVRGEEFFERIDDYARQQLPSMVADCYTGGEDPKARLKVKYRVEIINHIVTLRDVTVDPSTNFKNETIKGCMVRALETARFTDINMPDFLSPENETESMLVRPESLKRFFAHQENGTK